MARRCSDSEGEEERHDRFKSERNPSSVPLFRSNIPSSLENYSSRARSPLRQSSYKASRHRSRYSDERKYSPHRKARSSERKDSRDEKLSPRSKESKERRSGSSERKHSKHKHKKSHEKFKSERHEVESRTISVDKEIRDPDRRRSEEKIKHSEGKRSLEKEDKLSDHEQSESRSGEDSREKKVKKHKRSRDRSVNHDSKKKKKDKRHKRKHVKRKNGNESDSNNVDVSNTNNSHQSVVVEDSVDLTEEVQNLVDDLSNSGSSENEISSLPEMINQNGDSKDKGTESEHEEGELTGSESEQYFGPALPPGKKTEKSYGPQLPTEVDLYGPALPPAHPPAQERLEEEEEDETGDVIGPHPVGHESAAQSALEKRATILKYQMDNKPDEDASRQRESWMVELPEARSAQIGLGPRKFRTNPAPDMSDRSSWTDTPEDKLRKKMLGEEESYDVDSKKLEIMERNKEMELLAKKSEKKSKSLLDLHQKELKKKKKKEEKERGGKPPERVPFSRERDLQTNKFDEAQKRSIIKKAQLLDSRFSIGESKYL